MEKVVNGIVIGTLEVKLRASQLRKIVIYRSSVIGQSYLVLHFQEDIWFFVSRKKIKVIK